MGQQRERVGRATGPDLGPWREGLGDNKSWDASQGSDGGWTQAPEAPPCAGAGCRNYKQPVGKYNDKKDRDHQQSNDLACIGEKDKDDGGRKGDTR